MLEPIDCKFKCNTFSLKISLLYSLRSCIMKSVLKLNSYPHVGMYPPTLFDIGAIQQ